MRAVRTNRLRGIKQPPSQFVDAFARHGGDWHDISVHQFGRAQGLPDVVSHPCILRWFRQVGFGQSDNATLDSEQIDDSEMLARLWHHTIIGRNHQKYKIDAGRTRQHVVHEFFVARHVDETQDRTLRRGQICKAEVDRNTARFLFLEAVGIDAGERPHQRRFAVIDVSGGADDHDAGPFNSRGETD